MKAGVGSVIDWSEPQPSYEELAAELRAWQDAYAELLRQTRRLEVKANALHFDYEAAEAAVTFTQALANPP